MLVTHATRIATTITAQGTDLVARYTTSAADGTANPGTAAGDVVRTGAGTVGPFVATTTTRYPAPQAAASLSGRHHHWAVVVPEHRCVDVSVDRDGLALVGPGGVLPEVTPLVLERARPWSRRTAWVTRGATRRGGVRGTLGTVRTRRRS